jgi:hypothetical protein
MGWSHALHETASGNGHLRAETQRLPIVYGYVGYARNGYVFDSSAAQAAK